MNMWMAGVAGAVAGPVILGVIAALVVRIVKWRSSRMLDKRREEVRELRSHVRTDRGPLPGDRGPR